jgi:hypothetical protein
MKLIPPERYPNLIQLINRTYTDEVEQILSAGADENGTIICLAQDGNKQLAIEIGDNDVQIRLFDPTAQFNAPKPNTSDQIATNLQKLGDPIIGGWLRQIEQMLTTSDDLETAREALFRLYPDLDSTELTEQMTDATALASMAGFWEAGAEPGDEAEFAKIPEGTKRRRDGVDYVLKDSRWHKAEVQSETQKKTQNTSGTLQSMS